MEEVLKKEAVKDWWDEMSEAERQYIEQGLTEANKGELIPHEEVMKDIKVSMNEKGC